MKPTKVFLEKHIMAVTLMTAFLTLGGIAVWQMSTRSAEASKDKQNFQDRLRRGVASEVRFASAAATTEEIDEAVASTTDFIYRRSGLKLSYETRQRLTKAENKALKGESRLITVAELTDNLTASAVDRLAKLTDKEIQQAVEMSADENGDVRPRSDGSWGVVTKDELLQQVKAGLARNRSDEAELRSTLQPLIEADVNDRVTKLSAALPEQFGKSHSQGVTPTQALLIAYSVAADDPLTDSRAELDQMLVQKRIDSGQKKQQRKGRRDLTDRPYGPYGLLHPSAPHLFFSKNAVDKLLKLEEGGKK